MNNSDQRKISIALCTYNGARFLPVQLESFLTQTRLPDELVVCDDCSTDETLNILEKFKQTAPFDVRIYPNSNNLGSTKNFEKAIRLCQGELIFLSDQDDFWMPEKIENIENEFAQNSSIGMVFSNAKLVDENLHPSGKLLWDFFFSKKKQNSAREGKFFEILLSQNIVTGATMAFLSEFVERFTPIPEHVPNLIHDYWISLIIAAESEIGFLNEPLIKYRLHSGQQLGIGGGQLNDKADFQKHYSTVINILLDEIESFEYLKKTFLSSPKAKKRVENCDFDLFIKERQLRIEHLRERMNMPPEKVKRVLPIIREVLNGRYSKFSNGIFSAGKDILRK